MRAATFTIRFEPHQWANEIARARLIKQGRERLAMEAVSAGHTLDGPMDQSETYVGRTPDGRLGPTPVLADAEFILVNLVQPVR